MNSYRKNKADSLWRGLKFIKYMLRIGIACTFTGHGMNALAIKQNWIPLLTVYGFSIDQAKTIMPLIGALDLVVALLVLLHPMRMVIIWAIFWTLLTALTRLIAGEGIWEFIERASNWSAPLAFFLLNSIELYDRKNEWPTLLKKEKSTHRFSLQ